MKYDKKDASNALPEGTYPATIKAVYETNKDGMPLVSKRGEPMERVVYEVYPESGGTRVISDYFTNPGGVWRYKRLAVALGRGDEFDAQTFEAGNCIGEALNLTLSVESSPQYGDQNRIEEYAAVAAKPKPVSAPASTPRIARKEPKPQAEVEPMGEDDIPF